MKLETLERLVELKAKHPKSINLVDLKPKIERLDSEEEADSLVNTYIDEIWQNIIVRSHVVQVLKSYLQRPEIRKAGISYAGLETIMGLYFGSNPPQYLSPEQLKSILLELSSPLKGCLIRESDNCDSSDRFHVLKDYSVG
jgi:hypothetical protein